MRVVLVGEHPSLPSGFGQQVRLLADALGRRGHKVTVLTYKKAMWPGEMFEYFDVQGVAASLTNLDEVDEAIHRIAPDAVILFWSSLGLGQLVGSKAAFPNCPTFVWLPWEGSSLDAATANVASNLPAESLVHLSTYAKHMWKDVLASDCIIPHCYDPAFAGPRLPDRQRWADELGFKIEDNPVIILNMDRNMRHKRWDLSFDFVRRLKNRLNRRIVFIAHTMKMPTPDAVDEYRLPDLAKLYDIADNVVFTLFDWRRYYTTEELASLIASVDLRISTSEGEGFGIPTIETAMVGTPQLVTAHTTMPELLDESSVFLVEDSGVRYGKRALMTTPNVPSMVTAAMYILNNPERAVVECTRVREYVKNKFSVDTVADAWHTKLTTPVSYDPWTAYRWGAYGAVNHVFECRAVCAAITKAYPHSKVVECGSVDGVFVRLAQASGLDVVGVESDTRWKDKIDPAVNAAISYHDMVSTPWPSGDVVVLNDVFERIQGRLHSFLEKVAAFDVAFIRMQHCYKFGTPLVNFGQVRDGLLNLGMYRRVDLERLIIGKLNISAFTHQIWSKEPSALPSALNEVL